MLVIGENLSRKQEQAITSLLTETTISAAAEKAGVSEMTLHRWLKLEPFRSAYRAARREVVEKGLAQIQQASWAAATTLIKLLGSGSDAIRLRAATSILDQASKGVDLLDFEERLMALERQAKEDEEGQGRQGRR